MEHSSRRKIYNELAVATILLVVSLAINVTTVKSMVGKLYTLDCGAYGKFLVSKEQYDSVNVGDDIPSYLKGRGS